MMKKIWTDLKNNWLVLALLMGYFVIANYIWGSVCPVRILLHRDCPGCGLTRGCICVLTGEWKSAIEYNPISFGWVALCLYLLYQRYLSPKSSFHWELPVIVVVLITIFYFLLKEVLYII